MARVLSSYNANKLLNGDRFEIIRGKYFTKNITCPICKGTIPRPEEKRTDVNISVRMMADCVLDKTDTLGTVGKCREFLNKLIDNVMEFSYI